MDLKDIKTLVELMKKNDLSVFKLEREDFKIVLKRGHEPVIVSAPTAALPAVPVAGAASVAPAGKAIPAPAPAETAAPAPPAEDLKDIASPMVGTFYSSPSPEAASFVKVGDAVTAETVVCIIEAMKVMNEIKAELDGVVAELVAENGKPVQFGQALFRVRAK